MSKLLAFLPGRLVSYLEDGFLTWKVSFLPGKLVFTWKAGFLPERLVSYLECWILTWNAFVFKSYLEGGENQV